METNERNAFPIFCAMVTKFPDPPMTGDSVVPFQLTRRDFVQIKQLDNFIGSTYFAGIQNNKAPLNQVHTWISQAKIRPFSQTPRTHDSENASYKTAVPTTTSARSVPVSALVASVNCWCEPSLSRCPTTAVSKQPNSLGRVQPTKHLGDTFS